MKRLSTRDELIFGNPALLVGEEASVLEAKSFSHLLKPQLHLLGCSIGIGIVDCHLEQAAVQELALDRRCRRVRQKSGRGLDRKHSQCRLLSRSQNVQVQRVLGGPRNQLLRGVSPAQAERRLDQALGKGGGSGQERAEETCEGDFPTAVSQVRTAHPGSFSRFPRARKRRTQRRGFALVELTLALSILTVIGIMLLKLSLNILAPRQYVLQQVLTDSYLTFERAQAERIPFHDLTNDLTAPVSPWPTFPATTTTPVTIGSLPGGVPVTGQVVRTRFADTNNYPNDGDANSVGNVATNPAAMRIWRVQSVLRYQIAGRTYVKSRTVVRAQ